MKKKLEKQKSGREKKKENILIGGRHCYRCNHDWKQRGKKKPKKCPMCNNPNWDKQKLKDIVNFLIS